MRTPRAVTVALLGAVTLALAPVSPAAAATPWTVIPAASSLPQVPGGTLTAISCADAGHCVAVGNGVTADGHMTGVVDTLAGGAWRELAMPGTSRWQGIRLAGVACPSPASCTAVGWASTDGVHREPYGVTVDSGGTRELPLPALATTELSGISCPTTTACVAVGTTTPGYPENVDAGGVGPVALSITTGGAVSMPLGAAGPVALGAVACRTAHDCTAVGATDPLSNTDPGYFAVHWDGTSWVEQASPASPGKTGARWKAVSCPDGGGCVAVGTGSDDRPTFGVEQAGTWTAAPIVDEHGPVGVGVSCSSPAACTAVVDDGPHSRIERFDGTAWTTQPTAPAAPDDDLELAGVSCSGASTCVVAGSRAQGAHPARPEAERWDGRAWVDMTVPAHMGAASGSLGPTSCPSPSHCLVIGGFDNEDGLQSLFAADVTDAGWVRTPLPGLTDTDGHLSSLSCPTVDACVAVGNEGYGGSGTLVLRKDHGTWARIAGPPIPPDGPTALIHVDCPTASWCVVVGTSQRFDGDDPYVATWDGAAWAVLPVPVGPHFSAELDGVSCVGPQWCQIVGSVDPDVFSEDRPLGFLLQSGTMTEVPMAIPDAFDSALVAISCTTRSSCVSTGEELIAPAAHPGTALAERWDGTSWHRLATPASSYQVSPLSAVSCADAGHCLAVGRHDSRTSANGYEALAMTITGDTLAETPPAAVPGASGGALRGVACSPAGGCVVAGAAMLAQPEPLLERFRLAG